MTQLNRREPRHWHDEHGAHRLSDPRKFTGIPREHWDEDDLYYVRHLEAHEAEAAIPAPQMSDTAEIKHLFRVIELAEQTVALARDLINAKRARKTPGPPNVLK